MRNAWRHQLLWLHSVRWWIFGFVCATTFAVFLDLYDDGTRCTAWETQLMPIVQGDGTIVILPFNQCTHSEKVPR